MPGGRYAGRVKSAHARSSRGEAATGHKSEDRYRKLFFFNTSAIYQLPSSKIEEEQLIHRRAIAQSPQR